MSTFRKLAILAGVVGLLTGCSSGSTDAGGNWGNYKCTAVNQSGVSTMGWAADAGRAKMIALDKCRARSANPNSCHIAQCGSE